MIVRYCKYLMNSVKHSPYKIMFDQKKKTFFTEEHNESFVDRRETHFRVKTFHWTGSQDIFVFCSALYIVRKLFKLLEAIRSVCLVV